MVKEYIMKKFRERMRKESWMCMSIRSTGRERLAGVGEGLFLSVVTVYTCEIAPAAIRGFLVCTIQFFITIGLASGQLSIRTMRYQLIESTICQNSRILRLLWVE